VPDAGDVSRISELISTPAGRLRPVHPVPWPGRRRDHPKPPMRGSGTAPGFLAQVGLRESRGTPT
jgi:hypothetical protein